MSFGISSISRPYLNFHAIRHSRDQPHTGMNRVPSPETHDASNAGAHASQINPHPINVFKNLVTVNAHGAQKKSWQQETGSGMHIRSPFGSPGLTGHSHSCFFALADLEKGNEDSHNDRRHA